MASLIWVTEGSRRLTVMQAVRHSRLWVEKIPHEPAEQCLLSLHNRPCRKDFGRLFFFLIPSHFAAIDPIMPVVRAQDVGGRASRMRGLQRFELPRP